MATHKTCDVCGEDMNTGGRQESNSFYVVDKKTKIVFPIGIWPNKGYIDHKKDICDECGIKSFKNGELMKESEFDKIRDKWNKSK